MEIIARINIDTPTGRKIVRDLARRKVVKLEIPMSENENEKSSLTHDEIWSRVEKKMNEHYGTNHKLNY
ncbi:MAG: hypothetical protein Q4G63_02080 [Bacteroidia bacterium]|nr:hypothetical protein [Bacteroidia bacterium]